MNTWYKRLSILLVATIVLTLGVSIASAQEPPRDHPLIGAAALVAALTDMTGMTPQELLADVEPGTTTLAQVAEANGIDPAAVVAEASANITERINQAVENGRLSQEQADEILANLDANLTELMNQPIPERQRHPVADRIREAGIRTLVNALAEATGMDVADMLAQAQEQGLTTLAEIAEANGVAPEDVVAAAVADATEHINQAVTDGNLTQEQADNLIAGLEEAFTNAMNHPLPDRPQRPGIDRLREAGAQTLIGALADATGMEPREMLAQAREQGLTTLAEVAEANGVAPEDVVAAAVATATEHINQAVTDGHLTQEQADNLIAGLEEAFTNAMNHSFPQRPEGRPVDGRPGLRPGAGAPGAPPLPPAPAPAN